MISSDDINRYLDIVDKRVTKYIKATCPNITNEHLKTWRDRNFMKLMEPFEWIFWDDYLHLNTACEEFFMEAIVDEIFAGEYGNFFHIAALRIYMYEVVQNSGIIPFSFTTIETIK